VLGTATATFAGADRAVRIVALGRHGEAARGDRPWTGPDAAPPRPLLVFQRQADGSFTLLGRNDGVVMRADQGGQCDPFLDGDATIAVKGRFFTVENGVACGSHWTDYVTFRFDDAAGGYVFDNERLDSWSFNTSNDPNADALVEDGGAPKVTRGSRTHPVPFADWRPSR
jgi:hypothetical protein